MATKKIKTVSLVANGVSKEFSVQHAERLLARKNNGGWKLPEQSEFNWNGKNLTVK